VNKAAVAAVALAALIAGPPRASAFSSALVQGSVAVEANSYVRYRVVVFPIFMPYARIEGQLRASGGIGNDIKVYVFTDADFVNWANGHASQTLYESGQVSAADVKVPLPNPGAYYVVISNTFSLLTPKIVNGDLALVWDFPYVLLLLLVGLAVGLSWLIASISKKGKGKSRDWAFTLSAPHSVRVEHSAMSGKVVISVDGRNIFERESKTWDTGLEHRFEVEGKPCIIRIVYKTWHYDYELWVEGRLQ
jgi:hypothetical protein